MTAITGDRLENMVITVRESFLRVDRSIALG